MAFLKTQLALAAVAALAISMTAHSEPAPLSPQQIRQLTRQAALAAQITPGTPVCKRMKLGLAAEDWLRATVIDKDGRTATLRIDSPGQHRHTLQGQPLDKGSVIRADLADWQPCK